jgi:hypothetical protein
VRSKRNEANWGAAAEQSLANVRQILAARAGRRSPGSYRAGLQQVGDEGVPQRMRHDGFLDTAALAHDAASQRYWGPGD